MSLKQKSVTTALWERVFRSKSKSDDPATEYYEQDNNYQPKHGKAQSERDSEYPTDDPELSYELMNESTTSALDICGQPPFNSKAVHTQDSFSDSDNAEIYEETEDFPDFNEENEYLAMSETEEIYDEPPLELQISKRPLPVPPSVSPSDEYEVADLYDTIDDNAQKRLRKLAKMCSQQPKRDQIDVVEELYEEFDEDAESELPDASNPQGSRCVTEQKRTISEMGKITSHQSSNRVTVRCESISPPYTTPSSTPPDTPAHHCPPPASPSPPPPPPMHPQHSSQFPPPPLPQHPQCSSPSPPPPPPGYPECSSISPSPPPPSSPPPLSLPSYCPPVSSHCQPKSLPSPPFCVKSPPPSSMRPSTSKFIEPSEHLEYESYSCESQSLSTDIHLELHSSSPSLQPSFPSHSTHGGVPSSKIGTTRLLNPALPCPKKSPLKPPVLPKAAIPPRVACKSSSGFFRSSDSSNAHFAPSQQGDTTNQEDTQIETTRAMTSLNKNGAAHNMEMSMANVNELDNKKHVNMKRKPTPRPKPLPQSPSATKPLSSSPKLKQRISAHHEAKLHGSLKKQAEKIECRSQHIKLDHSEDTSNEQCIPPKQIVLGTKYNNVNEDKESRVTHLRNCNFEKLNDEMKVCAENLQTDHSDHFKLDQDVSRQDVDDTTVNYSQKQDPIAGKRKTPSEAEQFPSKAKYSPKGLALSMPQKSPFEHQTTAHIKERIEIQKPKGDPNSASNVSTHNGATLTNAKLVQTSERHIKTAAPITAQPAFKATLSGTHKNPSLPPKNLKLETLKIKEQALGSEISSSVNAEKASVKNPNGTETFCISTLKGEKLNKNKPPILPKRTIVSQNTKAKSYLDITIQDPQTEPLAKSRTKKPILPQKPASIKSSSPLLVQKESGRDDKTSIKSSSPLLVQKESGRDDKTECSKIMERKLSVPNAQLAQCGTNASHGEDLRCSGPGSKSLLNPVHNGEHNGQSTADGSNASNVSDNIVKSKFYRMPIDGKKCSSIAEDMSRSVSPLCSVAKSYNLFSSEIHESISSDICNEETMNNYSPQKSIKHSIQDTSSGHRQSSQTGSAPMMKELSTVLLSMKSKSTASEQHHNHTDGDTVRGIHNTPTQLKGWKALHSTESTRYKQEATTVKESSIDSSQTVSTFQDRKYSKFVNKPSKSPTPAAHVTKRPNPVQKSSLVRSMACSEIKHESTAYMSSTKPPIEPKSIHPSKSDERRGHVISSVLEIQKNFKDETTRAVDIKGGARKESLLSRAS